MRIAAAVVSTAALTAAAWPVCLGAQGAGAPVATAASKLPALGANLTLAAAACAADRLGAPIPVSAIGEPVSAITLTAPTWVDATPTAPAHCRVDGTMAPVSTAPGARPIQFRVVLPASWNHRGAQVGGGGMNGTVPSLTGVNGTLGVSVLAAGFAAYGSDSGHTINGGDDWTTNDEAIQNLGYAQLKKTHDAAMILIERAYGERPRFNYFFGTSQGGREALTVAERYAADYDGIVANVPIVNFSTLMLAPELIRIQEKPIANWVTRAKVNAIRGEFMRQCDGLDGLVDGVINNYMACRALFDGSRGANANPWVTKRCPNNVDPNPADTSAAACLTDGQISTLRMVYSRYRFAAPLANGVTTFGMWVPNTDPSGSGLIVDQRFRGQEGVAPDGPKHSHLGVLGVTGFLMKDPANANPLDYVEGGALAARRMELSRWLDSTDPNLAAFYRRGGKLIVTIGTDDTLASPGAQLDYYQSVIDTMGRATVDAFARLFVLPQTNHGLRGNIYTTDGEGKTIPTAPIPVSYDRLALIQGWAERNEAPGMSVTVTGGDRSLPLCSYPTYPRYVSGPVTAAASYACR